MQKNNAEAALDNFTQAQATRQRLEFYMLEGRANTILKVGGVSERHFCGNEGNSRTLPGQPGLEKYIQQSFNSKPGMQMKRLIGLLGCLLLVLGGLAQSSYEEAIRQGEEALNSRDFKMAINKYFAAEAFDPSKKEEVSQKVNEVFDKIEGLRKQAESAKKEAEDALEKLQEAQQETARGARRR